MPQKRKHIPHNTSELGDLIRVKPKEFLAPLSVEACARRLQERNSYRTEIDLIRFRPNAYRYFMTRIIRRDMWRNHRITVRGTLEFWDEQTTLVKIRADFHYGFLWLAITLILPLVFLLFGAPFQSVMGLFVFCLAMVSALFITLVHHVDEQRAMVHIIEDLLRAPVVFRDGAPEIMTNELTDPFYGDPESASLHEDDAHRAAGSR